MPHAPLTHANYFDEDRDHVSVSQLKSYLVDPWYYFRCHIIHDPKLAFKVTGVMQRGSVVDERLTSPKSKWQYERKVLKKDDPEVYEDQQLLDPQYLVPARYFDEALQVVKDIKRQNVWTNSRSKTEFQTILEGTIEGVLVCGMADRIDSCGKDKYKLIDLKVTQASKNRSATSWGWHCADMRYFHQLALYQYLFALQKGIPIENVSTAHITAAYVSPGLTQVRVFTINQSHLDKAMAEIRGALAGVKACKFRPNNVSWRDAVEI